MRQLGLRSGSFLSLTLSVSLSTSLDLFICLSLSPVISGPVEDSHLCGSSGCGQFSSIYVYNSFSLSLSHTHAHTDTQLHIQVQSRTRIYAAAQVVVRTGSTNSNPQTTTTNSLVSTLCPGSSDPPEKIFKWIKQFDSIFQVGSLLPGHIVNIIYF